MLCITCQKLAIKPQNKKCVHCKGIIQINLAVICEECSNKEKLCAICLKKIVSGNNNTKSGGCGCGGR